MARPQLGKVPLDTPIDLPTFVDRELVSIEIKEVPLDDVGGVERRVFLIFWGPKADGSVGYQNESQPLNDTMTDGAFDAWVRQLTGQAP